MSCSLHLKKTPILSFCIPTYNRAQRVYDCVSDILKYPGDEIEVVVSNNASTDNTLELLGTIDDKRLKVYSNRENLIALNWPLAVSLAEAQWAALMSDEDFVNLYDLPYFFSLLPKAAEDGIGGIIYSFPPITGRWSEYTCKSRLESLHAGFRHSGHITGHIINMDYFELGELGDYNNRFRNGYDDPAYLGKPYVMEPHHEIIRRIALDYPIMFTDKELCLFGTDEKIENQEFIEEVKKTTQWGGFSPDYREITIATALESLKTISVENKIQYTTAVISAYEMMLLVVMEYYIGVVCGTHKYRPALFKYAKEKLQHTIDDAKLKVLEHLDSFLRQYPQTIHPELFEALRYYLREIFNNSNTEFIHTKMDFMLKTMLGNTLCSVHTASNRVTLSTIDEYSKSYLVELIDNPNDVFSFKQTDDMTQALYNYKLDNVITNFNQLNSPKADFNRGAAYLLKKDYASAKSVFEALIKRLNNPITISDIMIEATSVAAVYYYLGFIYHELGCIADSMEYYSSCKTITDNLFLGPLISKKGLWFGTCI